MKPRWYDVPVILFLLLFVATIIRCGRSSAMRSRWAWHRSWGLLTKNRSGVESTLGLLMLFVATIIWASNVWCRLTGRYRKRGAQP